MMKTLWIIIFIAILAAPAAAADLELNVGMPNYIGNTGEWALRATSPALKVRYGGQVGVHCGYETAEFVAAGQHGHDISFLSLGVDSRFSFSGDRFKLTLGVGYAIPDVQPNQAARESMALLMNTYYMGTANHPWWDNYELTLDPAFYGSIGAKAAVVKEFLFLRDISLSIDFVYRTHRAAMRGWNGDFQTAKETGYWTRGINIDSSAVNVGLSMAF